MRFDLILCGGEVIDGSGAPPVRADVGVTGARVTALGDLAAADAARRVDVGGRVVTPGFVDVHSHDDFAVLLHRDMSFKVLQGVTTEVVGNCGFGAAPGGAGHLFGKAFHPGESIPDWVDYDGYFSLLEAAPPSLNVVALAGHGTIRLAAMGGERRAATAAEMDRMRGMVRDALDQGCVGLSTGLVYEPGRNADSAEIVALARELGPRGIYASHMRNEAEGLLDSIRETIAVGEAAGVPVQISHHKAAGRANHGLVRESLRLIDEARARGVDVLADQYPYVSGSTTLLAVVENGAIEDESDGEETRPPERAASGLGRLRPEDVRLATAPDHPEWEGRTMAEIGALLGVDGRSAAERVLAAEGPRATVVLQMMAEADVRTVLAHPSTMIGSDGLPTLRGKPHPRLWGTFPRVLSRYVRATPVLSLPEAVARMTSLPARRFGLTDRGTLRVGAWADLVVFDPVTIADLATEEDPHRAPAGIARVYVNGVEVARDGSHTGAFPGRMLRADRSERG